MLGRDSCMSPRAMGDSGRDSALPARGPGPTTGAMPAAILSSAARSASDCFEISGWPVGPSPSAAPAGGRGAGGRPGPGRPPVSPLACAAPRAGVT